LDTRADSGCVAAKSPEEVSTPEGHIVRENSLKTVIQANGAGQKSMFDILRTIVLKFSQILYTV